MTEEQIGRLSALHIERERLKQFLNYFKSNSRNTIILGHEAENLGGYFEDYKINPIEAKPFLKALNEYWTKRIEEIQKEFDSIHIAE
jgi:hypothetical protein